MQGSYIFVALNTRLERNTEEEILDPTPPGPYGTTIGSSV